MRKIFDRGEEIAAWLGNMHHHPGPNEPCAIRDRICTAIHEACQEREQEILNTPEIEDFLKAVKIEAAHQKERWQCTDPEKMDAEFFWLLGWLGGKAIHDPHDPDDKRTPRERKLHRIIALAAAAFNWHEQVKARTHGEAAKC